MDVMEEEPEVRDKEGARDLEKIKGDVGFETVRFGYGNGPEVYMASTSKFPRARPWRSSATRAPASRRSRSSSRASTTRARDGSRSTASTSGT